MEFNEKLQELRKKKGLTQEGLAQALYVSRTAVSKWESGKGYPGIDSLKAIASFFDVTVDSLLSSENLLDLAQKEGNRRERLYRNIIFGLLDCAVGMFFFLPLFAYEKGGIPTAVSLLRLDGIAPYMKGLFVAVVVAIVVWGVLTLALQNVSHPAIEGLKSKISLALNSLGILLFILSPQPYAAAFLFVFLAIKLFFSVKWQ